MQVFKLSASLSMSSVMCLYVVVIVIDYVFKCYELFRKG